MDSFWEDVIFLYTNIIPLLCHQFLMWVAVMSVYSSFIL